MRHRQSSREAAQMAIFSVNHTFIGRTTDPKGSASLFARYITRPEACTEVLGERVPLDRSSSMHFGWTQKNKTTTATHSPRRDVAELAK
jgi:hypothetical protein